jgi:hypothetical protein
MLFGKIVPGRLFAWEETKFYMLSVKLMQTFYTLYYQQLPGKERIETM